MIVNDQQLYEDKHKKKVSLTGLTFYMNDNTGYSDSAEVFFSGWHTWWFDYDEFLDLEKNQKIKVIDRETFTNEIKGYTKSLEIFINDWIERYFRSIDNEEEE
jgi:murein L,D-transpeptidase YafK